MGSTYLGHSGVDRHCCIKGNAQAVGDPQSLWGFSGLQTPWHLLTLFQHSSSHNPSFSQFLCRCCGCCTICQHHVHVIWDILWGYIKQVWRCTWRPRWSQYRVALGGHNWASLEMSLEAMNMQTWRPWSWRFADAHEGRDRVNSVVQLEAEIWWTQRFTRWP